VRIHSLRHFYASMLIAAGEDLKYISSQLGHASIQITVDRYGHLLPGQKRQATARLEAQLNRAVSCSSDIAERTEPAEMTLEQSGSEARAKRWRVLEEIPAMRATDRGAAPASRVCP